MNMIIEVKSFFLNLTKPLSKPLPPYLRVADSWLVSFNYNLLLLSVLREMDRFISKSVCWCLFVPWKTLPLSQVCRERLNNIHEVWRRRMHVCMTDRWLIRSLICCLCFTSCLSSLSAASWGEQDRLCLTKSSCDLGADAPAGAKEEREEGCGTAYLRLKKIYRQQNRHNDDSE